MKEERKGPEAIARANSGRIDQEWEKRMKRNVKHRLMKSAGIKLQSVFYMEERKITAMEK